MINQAKSILKKLNLDTSNSNYKEIREMLHGRDGYVGLFTKLHFLNKTPLTALKNLAVTINEHVLVQQLPKPLIQYEEFEKIQDDLEKVKLSMGAKQMYDCFPAAQKKLVSLENENERNLLYELSKNKNKEAFLTKISSYKGKKGLLTSLKNFINASNEEAGRHDAILKRITDRGIQVFHKSVANRIIIARVFNHSEICNIASDTSWCIVRESSTFNSYVRNRDDRQFVIFLTDKDETDVLRKIGCTFSINGQRGNGTFSTAHSLRDGYVDFNQLKTILAQYKYDINKLQIGKKDLSNIDSHPISVLTQNVGFTLEELLILKRQYNSKDLEHFSAEQIDKHNLMDKTSIEGSTLIKKFSKEEIMSRNMFRRVVSGTMPLKDLLTFDIDYIKQNYDEIKKMLSNAHRDGISDIDFLNEHLKIKPKGAHDYRVGNKWSNHDRYSAEKTIFKLKWYGINSTNFTIEDLRCVFDDASIYDSEIFKYIKESGWKFSKAEILTFITKTFRKSQFETYMEILTRESIQSVIEKTSDLQEIKAEFLDALSDYAPYGYICGIVKEYDLKKINELYTKKELFRFEFIQKSLSFGKELEDIVYRRYHKTVVDEQKMEEFYTKWNDFVQTSFTLQFRKGHPTFKQEHQAYLAILYCKLGRLKELNNIPFNWQVGCGSFNEDGANLLADVITDEYRTNGGLNIKLNDSERQKMFYWFSKYLAGLTYSKSWGHEEKQVKDEALSVMYYLYDEDAWLDYVDRVKNIKAKSKTPRVEYLRKVIDYMIAKNKSNFSADLDDKGNKKFFIDEEKIRELNKILAILKTWNYGLMEFKASMDQMHYLHKNSPAHSILSQYACKIFRSFSMFTYERKAPTSHYWQEARWVDDYLSTERFNLLFKLQ